tara:strand:- start:39 stop:422 length:384 start_codon:yes stop_codon:yes gene_type:complete
MIFGILPLWFGSNSALTHYFMFFTWSAGMARSPFSLSNEVSPPNTRRSGGKCAVDGIFDCLILQACHPGVIYQQQACLKPFSPKAFVQGFKFCDIAEFTSFPREFTKDVAPLQSGGNMPISAHLTEG